MNTAQIALVVSIIGTLLALAALAWNMTVFVRSGPRIQASMAMGAREVGKTLEDGSATTTLTIRTWSSSPNLRMRSNQHFAVTATNSGRAAIWVDAIGVCSADSSVNYNMSIDSHSHAPGFGPTLPFKLDAGQTERWTIPISAARVLATSVAETDCIHGEITLGNGTVRRTKEGARVGLILEAMEHGETD